MVAVLIPFFLLIQFLFPALMARGKVWAAGALLLLFYVALLYLGGAARFRALRYRLSRTWWHGIRGGSDNPGWKYGAEYLGRYGLTFLTAWIIFPWATTRLWNSRWNAMSFGPLEFTAHLSTEGLKRRWAAVYLVPLAVIFVGSIVAGMAVAAIQPDRIGPFTAIFVGIVILFYLVIPLMTLHWFAKFYRHAAESIRLGELEFGFDATTWDWLKLFLGNLGLAVVTLGFGLAFWGYRNWAFMVRHTHLYGVVDLATLTQSTVSAPAEAEGWADAFDVGAI